MQRGIRDLVEVKPNTAKVFMAAEEKRGTAPKTWKDILKLPRATFKRLHPHPFQRPPNEPVCTGPLRLSTPAQG